MKNITRFLNRPTLRGLVIGLAALALSSQIAKATPYASGCTNYTGDQNGDIGFFINESGSVTNPQTVTVIYDDGTTNANFNGITTGLNVPRGSNYFNLAGHNGYQIRVFKLGTGAPSKISVDTESNSIWANPRGLAVNCNPKIGPEFGRIYVGSSAPGGYGWGTPGFKGCGIYALNADFTTALGRGTNAYLTSSFLNNPGPWRLRVAAAGTGLDNQLIASDFSGTGAALYICQPDLSSLQPLLKGVGQAAGLAAQTHSDSLYEGVLVGSLAAGTLQLWITEADWAIPGTFADYGPNTGSGMYNDLLRFDIGPGPIPADGWPGPPQYAYTVGLAGIANLRPFVEIGKDGKIFAGFGRANGSNPNLQVLDPTGHTFLYMSGVNPPYYNQDSSTLPAGNDPWNGVNGSGANIGTYGGIRVSPDGRYIASADYNSGITVANLTHGNADPNLNGLPDDTTIFPVPNATYASVARGMDWDAADNIYITGGQLLTRAYSLGGTTTCVTSNDWTGTNGTFSTVLPPVIATLTVTQPYASQNYGTPIPGVARIEINTNALSAPFTVSFSRGGTAGYNNPSAAVYQINTNSSPWLPFGVKILTNSVIFPAGTNICGVGTNFYVDVVITPTTFPVSTNTQTVILGLANPSAYQFGTPSKGTIYLQNTGPQLLVLTAAAAGASMYRGVTNDYAKFVITRFGDTNGPGNSAGNVSQVPYTVTNLNYYGTANYTNDYRARAQRADPAADGKIQTPVDGPTAIVIYPGDTAVTCIVGNPVMHTNFNYTPTNLTIIFNLTNAVTCGVGGACTNGIPTPEGFTYNVRAATVTLTEVDNAVGPEVVLWSDTMTNAANSVNYTLTYAGTNFGVGAMPVVVPNYINNQTSIYGGETNDFMVNFGSDIATNAVPVPPSPVMLASNWPQKALKMTVNKASSTICGVNVYPAAQHFYGNYALRFNMFLSLWDQYINDPYVVGNYREYALFGVNHSGTNGIWRPSTTMVAGSGMIPTNSDGQWFAIDAGSGGTTPADYEVYIPGPVPNNANANGTGLKGMNSWSGTSPVPQGYLKHPPFDTMNTTEATRTVAAPGGGAPIDKWVDVSVEITAQTNLTLWINRSTWLASAAITNGLGWGYAYTNGTIMLGYDDPDRNVSGPSAFVYYSNVRVVELSPYIALQPTLTNTTAYSLIRTQGSSLVLTAAVNYATAPITSVWFRASVATVGSAAGETLSNPYVQSNWFNATSADLSLALNNVQAVSGTNFVLQVRDPAGSVNSAPVALEVVSGPTNAVASIGSTFQWAVRSAGPAVVTPSAYQWMTNSVNLATNAHYNGVNFTNMWITNVQSADAGTYSVLVTSPAGTVTPAATLTVVSAIAPASQTNLWGSTASFTVTATGATPTYQWKKNNGNVIAAPNITGANSSVLTISPVLATNAGTYTVGVTNGLGVLVAQGILTVSVPPPVFTPGGASLVGGNMVMSFSSPNNIYDTTNAFILLQSPIVLVTNTPWTTNTSAVWTTNGASPPQFQVTVPQIGDTMFYCLRHVYP